MHVSIVCSSFDSVHLLVASLNGPPGPLDGSGSLCATHLGLELSPTPAILWVLVSVTAAQNLFFFLFWDTPFLPRRSTSAHHTSLAIAQRSFSRSIYTVRLAQLYSSNPQFFRFLYTSLVLFHDVGRLTLALPLLGTFFLYIWRGDS